MVQGLKRVECIRLVRGLDPAEAPTVLTVPIHYSPQYNLSVSLWGLSGRRDGFDKAVTGSDVVFVCRSASFTESEVENYKAPTLRM
jgi:hypothetical protein